MKCEYCGNRKAKHSIRHTFGGIVCTLAVCDRCLDLLAAPPAILPTIAEQEQAAEQQQLYAVYAGSYY